MEQPRGSVIVLTWNACDVLARCLESLESQTLAGGFETIVVDNASTDVTLELLRGRGNRVRVIANDRNAGFSAPNNEAARAAVGEVLFFLNSDTELLAPDTLARLAEAVEAPGVAIAGPTLVNPDGSLQPSCAAHPSIGGALVIASGLHRLVPQRLRAHLVPQFWSHDRPVDTGWLMGAALAVRADVFREVGGFWPHRYAEEQDLAYRVQQRGMRVRFDNSARILHVGNYSFAQRWSDAERAAYVAAAELTFLRTHYSRPRRIVIRMIVGMGHAVRALAHAMVGRPRRAAVFRSMARVYWFTAGRAARG
jgi:GT2 family glycosyltransferase